MKLQNLNFIGLFAALCMLLTGCGDDSHEPLNPDTTLIDFNSAEIQPTEKLGGGLKMLNFTVRNTNQEATFSVVSDEWTLKDGSYNVTVAPGTNGSASARINGVEMSSGKLFVSTYEGKYFMRGIFADTAGNKYQINFNGILTFEVGEDAPEPSGCLVYVFEDLVWDENNNAVKGLTKYSIWVNAADGSNLLMIDAINTHGLTMKELPGVYKIQSYPGEAWLADTGWVWGEWNGGSFYVDNAGNQRFITGGEITITMVEGAAGECLFTFTGENLQTLNANGDAGNGSFSIPFASVWADPNKGEVKRNQIVASAILGRDMKYSVCLPKGYDPSKEYPVLYMLHGMDGDNNDWISFGKIDNVLADTGKEVVVIMPEAMNSFYVDGFQPGINYASYFFNEFMPAIEDIYHVRDGRNGRGVAGLSMGGYGALYYGALRPDLFCSVYACSPSPYVEGAADLIEIFNSTKADGCPDIKIEVGTEDFLYGDVTRFDGELSSNGILHNVITRPGYHNWDFWRGCTTNIIDNFAELTGK